MTLEADVLIIGAGLSGLTAARALERAGRRIVVLEAASRVGGRVLTEDVGGDHVDLGAHWIGPTQDRIAALIRELGLAIRPQPIAGRSVLHVGGRRIVYRGETPLLPVLLVDAGMGTARLWRLGRQVGFAGGADARRVSLDQRTGADLRDSLYRTAAARRLFDMSVGLMLGEEPAALSALHLAAFMRSGGGLVRLSRFKGGAQQDHVVGGMQQVCERLVAGLAGTILLDAPVNAMEQSEDGVTASYPGGRVHAGHAVVAIPPPRVAEIAFTPALPGGRTELLERMRMGAYTKSIARYDRPWWRDQGLSGTAFDADGLIQMVVDGDSETGGTLVGFSTGPAARRLAELDAAARRAEAVRAFEQLLGPEARSPAAFREHAWATECWIGGAPVALPARGALSTAGDLPRAPVGRLHWAGTDLAERHNAYLDGAVRSGERAAAEILA
jgi:monoamine oxidase